MEKGSLVLVTGGTRSGKSEFAELLTESYDKPVVYIATATVKDAEMEMRVQIHRSRRPGNWRTLEEPLDVSAAIKGYGTNENVVMLDCMTFLITNLMFRQELPEDEVLFKKLEEEILLEISHIVTAAREQGTTLVVVSNESGLGLIPPDRLTRKYQELVGRANQIIAKDADLVYLVVAGLPVEIKKNAQIILNQYRRD